jgi:hypothetical protein
MNDRNSKTMNLKAPILCMFLQQLGSDCASCSSAPVAYHSVAMPLPKSSQIEDRSRKTCSFQFQGNKEDPGELAIYASSPATRQAQPALQINRINQVQPEP